MSIRLDRAALRELILDFYATNDPQRLQDGIDINGMVDWTMQRGLPQLNQMLNQTYGVTIDPTRRIDNNNLQSFNRISTALMGPVNFENETKKRAEIEGKLNRFYAKHDPLKKQGVPKLVDFAMYKGVENLNEKLMSKYGEDLDSFEKAVVSNIPKNPPKMAVTAPEIPMTMSKNPMQGQMMKSPMVRETVPPPPVDDMLPPPPPMEDFVDPKAIEDELRTFYNAHDPGKLDVVEAIATWVMKIGRIEFNKKLIQLYGFNLDDPLPDDDGGHVDEDNEIVPEVIEVMPEPPMNVNMNMIPQGYSDNNYEDDEPDYDDEPTGLPPQTYRAPSMPKSPAPTAKMFSPPPPQMPYQRNDMASNDGMSKGAPSMPYHGNDMRSNDGMSKPAPPMPDMRSNDGKSKPAPPMTRNGMGNNDAMSKPAPPPGPVPSPYKKPPAPIAPAPTTSLNAELRNNFAQHNNANQNGFVVSSPAPAQSAGQPQHFARRPSADDTHDNVSRNGSDREVTPFLEKGTSFRDNAACSAFALDLKSEQFGICVNCGKPRAAHKAVMQAVQTSKTNFKPSVINPEMNSNRAVRQPSQVNPVPPSSGSPSKISRQNNNVAKPFVPMPVSITSPPASKSVAVNNTPAQYNNAAAPQAQYKYQQPPPPQYNHQQPPPPQYNYQQPPPAQYNYQQQPPQYNYQQQPPPQYNYQQQPSQNSNQQQPAPQYYNNYNQQMPPQASQSFNAPRNAQPVMAMIPAPATSFNNYADLSNEKADPLKGPALVKANKAGEACNNYRLDMTGATFGVCQCGYPKADHKRKKMA